MNPLLRSPRSFLLALAGWSPLCAAMTALGGLAGGLPWGSAALLTVPPMIPALFLSTVVWFLCRHEPLGLRRMMRLAAAHGAGLILFALIWVGLISLQAAVLDLASPAAAHDWIRVVAGLREAYLAAGAGLYVLVALFSYLLLAVERSYESEKIALEQRWLASRSELRALRATVHPHFLFNGLTALAGLIPAEPERARRVCLDLADFLRYSLRLNRRDWVTVNDEVRHCRQYLGIEQARLGDRLTVRWSVSPRAKRKALPPLTLLPLVENAVKHGIQPRLEGGTITIRVTTASPGRLHVEVENPEPPADAAKPAGEQLGLQTLAQRLAIHYQGEVKPRLEKKSGRIIVSLNLPLGMGEKKT